MQSFYCDQGHILLTRFNFDPTWISNHKPSKVWGDITFQTCTAEAWEWISNFHDGCNYLSMLGLKLNHVSKRGHRNVSPKAHWIILLARLAHIMLFYPSQLSAYLHDDVIKWKYFPRYWPFVRGMWIPRTKASDAELWYFLWSAST